MKTLLTLIFLLTASISWTQELELDFAHRYGIIENDLRHGVNFVEYFEDNEIWLVAGTFQSEIDLGINETAILTSENEARLSFVVIYNSDFQILNYFSAAGSVAAGTITENMVYLTGSFEDEISFDGTETFLSESSLGNGFVSSYSMSGAFNWGKVFISDGAGNRGKFCFTHDSSVFIIDDYDGSNFGGSFHFVDDENDLEIFSNGGPSPILFEFSNTGEYLSHTQFEAEEALIDANDFLKTNDKMYISFTVFPGEFDAGISSSTIFNFENGINVVVCGYDLNTFELDEYYLLKSNSPDSDVRQTYFSKIPESTEIYLATKQISGSVSVISHLGEEVEFSYPLNSAAIYRLDSNEGLIDEVTITSNSTLLLTEILKLENGGVIIPVSYQEDFNFESIFLDENSNSPDFKEAIIYINSQFNGVELFVYNGNQIGQLTNNTIVEPYPGKLVIAGRYQYEYDMDFSDDFAGFIASYNLDLSLELKELNSNEFFVFPNPSSDVIMIKSDNLISFNYAITNLLGEELISGTKSSSSATVIDVSNLRSGVYIIKINNKSTQLIIQ